jgi:hydrogenase small subunit
MPFLHKKPTTYEVLKSHGVDRRTFLDFCTRTTALMGLAPAMVPSVVKALVTQPRVPVIWLHGLECTCCSESLLRASHPIVSDIILNLISLDYDDTLQVAAGFQAEEIRQSIMKQYAGQYLLAVEGNAPTKDRGVQCLVGGKTFRSVLEESASRARAVIAWGSCATSGCIQAASPNPTGVRPVSALIRNKPVINVPGCPPIADVMAGVIAYVVTQGKLPELDSQGRPKMYYSKTVHEECERKDNFEEGRFVQNWGDDGARKGWCLFKMGCRGPITHNRCSEMKWNGGTSWPVDSGHPCIGCAEKGFWDNGPLYQQLAGVRAGGREHDEHDEHDERELVHAGER